MVPIIYYLTTAPRPAKTEVQRKRVFELKILMRVFERGPRDSFYYQIMDGSFRFRVYCLFV